MKAFGSTDIGNVRQENEDDFFLEEDNIKINIPHS